jgi:adenylate cyclase
MPRLNRRHSMTRYTLSRRNLRLTTGLVLFSYVGLHLTNHALGLVSVAVAERGLEWAVRVWHGYPGTVLLYGAAGIHLALALDAIYGCRTLRMAPLDLLRIVLGLGIPTLLIGHAVGTRLAWEMYQQSPHYSRVVWSLWVTDGQGRQLALLVPGWLHGCLGVHLAFCARPMYQRIHRPLFAAALLLPVLGGLGFLAMGKELAADLSGRGRLDASLALPGNGATVLLDLRQTLLVVYFSAIAAVFVARGVRSWNERRSNALVNIAYPQRTLRVPRGWSVLEASRSHQMPHLSMCGGRARCSTCRIRVTSGAEHCLPPGAAEKATLTRIRAREGVRLACQLRPSGDISVVLLMGPVDRPGARLFAPAAIEQDLVLVGVDWRNRDALTRALLPQDAVFLSRRFSETVSTIVRAGGGLECDPGVDGTRAVFGVGIEPSRACQRALSVAHDVEQALSDLDAHWKGEFGVAPDFALCVHLGLAALGEIETGRARRYIVAGPAVDASDRLRAAAAKRNTHILVSVDVLRHGGVHPAVIEDLGILEIEDGAVLRVAEMTSLHGVNALPGG